MAVLGCTLALFACVDSPSETGASDNTNSSTSDTAVPGPDRRDTSGTCTPSTGTCVDATFRELFRETEYYGTESAPRAAFHETIDSNATWQTWWQSTGSTEDLPAVNFEEETVLVSGYSINASCAVSLQSVGVTDCGGTVRLTTTSLDISGTCFVSCDTPGGTVVAIAAPHGTTEVCAQVDLTCGSRR